MIIQIIINAIAFYITSYIIPGFAVTGIETLLVMAIVWGIISLLFKPVLVILTLPINILTLGLFTFVINAVLLLVLSRIVPGFSIDNFGTALISSVVLSLVNMFLSGLKK